MIYRTLLLFLLGLSTALAAPAVKGPATAKVGAEVPVVIRGSTNPRDFVTIVQKGSAAGAYDQYQYVNKQGPIKLTAPPKAGEYEIRLLGADSPYPTLASQPLRLEAVAVTLSGPDQVAAGAPFDVNWTGPNNARDYIAIGNASQPYITYSYTNQGNPAKLTAPEQAGDYELRYILGNGDEIVGRRPLRIGSVSASVTAPTQVNAGAKFKVNWKGPNNERDFITIVPIGTADKQYDAYQYTSRGNPVELMAPDKPGDYEVRYLTAQSYATLGVAKVNVTKVSASLQAPAEVVAGTTFPVTWKGPNNTHDYLTIVAKGAKEGVSGNYAYTERGNPAQVLAPMEAGDYELRYSTGQSHATLANAAIRITPAKQEPGYVNVSSASPLATGTGVEIILDASGSMLQRLGGQRRIDIAKQTLADLTTKNIPAGTPFAMRVFGREVDSCQTDLEIALSPLDIAAVTARIKALEAKNNAKTPIGASLEKVVDDLKTVHGERLVILLTDGEETCGGDPAAAIEKLKAAGVTVRVNIVGFAIDDAKLATTFRHWAASGNGMFFDAKDAAGLGKALADSLQPGYEVVDAKGQVVAEGIAGGKPALVPSGNYSVRVRGQRAKAQPIVVKPKETTSVKL